MDINQTEEQQVETIKRIWSDYGNSIIAGLTIGFAGFIGFNYYQDNKLQNEMATSEAYQAVVELTAEESNTQFRQQGEKFIAEHAESNYAVLAALALAKDAASHKDWAKAESYLSTAIDKSSDTAIKGIATLRKARVQLQQDKADLALATLATPLAEAFKASAEEIKGDAYLAQEKTELARNAYQAAIDASGDAAAPALQMKLDDLAENISLTK
ncbi:MAG: YfgM family protein [Thalassotalea sp.]